LSYGLQLPTRAQILNFGNIAGWVQRSPALFTKFLTFGGGASLFGLGVADAELVASMTYNSARSLYQAQVRTLDTTPAQLVVGDKYPILTQAFVGTTPGGSQSTGSGLAFPPTVQFTDLGLTLKVTPRIHSAEEVGLDVETEFKVLTGQSANSIPVIATRSYRGTVRLKQGEWAVVAGLVTDSDTRSLSGIPLVRDVPGLGSRGRDKRRGDTLLVIRPRVLTLPPSESLVTRGIGVGTEGRLRAPL
jgi:type II secretory pathway component GspD/PulD (secretin)